MAKITKLKGLSGLPVQKTKKTAPALNKGTTLKITDIIKRKPVTRVVNLPNGRVELFLDSGLKPVNTIKPKIRKLGKDHPMCLSREEVNGQKSEQSIVIVNPDFVGDNILPGNIISGQNYLNNGSFIPQEKKNRKPISLTASSNLVNKKTSQATASQGEDITAKLANAVHELKRPGNILPDSMPNKISVNELSISTLKESIALQVAVSGFFMGVSASNVFEFSNEKYRYMYVFKFEQHCMTIHASPITSPDDVLAVPVTPQDDWFYVKDVTYGRRLYVILESEYDLTKYSNKFTGSWDWGIVGAEISQKTSVESFLSFTNLRVVSQGGPIFPDFDPKNIDASILSYLQTPFRQFDIVPLTFSLTDLNGKPVSLLAKAFLDGKNCLSVEKVRVRIKELLCLKADDGASDDSEQIYGSVAVSMTDDKGVPLMIGKLKGVPFPVASIVYASEKAPIRLIQQIALTKNDPVLKDKYLDLPIKNLDYKISLKPEMKEKDDFGDDVFLTNNKFNMSIRDMLWEGESVKTFEFRHDKSRVHLTVAIEPI